MKMVCVAHLCLEQPVDQCVVPVRSSKSLILDIVLVWDVWAVLECLFLRCVIIVSSRTLERAVVWLS